MRHKSYSEWEKDNHIDGANLYLKIFDDPQLDVEELCSASRYNGTCTRKALKTIRGDRHGLQEAFAQCLRIEGMKPYFLLGNLCDVVRLSWHPPVIHYLHRIASIWQKIFHGIQRSGTRVTAVVVDNLGRVAGRGRTEGSALDVVATVVTCEMNLTPAEVLSFRVNLGSISGPILTLQTFFDDFNLFKRWVSLMKNGLGIDFRNSTFRLLTWDEILVPDGLQGDGDSENRQRKQYESFLQFVRQLVVGKEKLDQSVTPIRRLVPQQLLSLTSPPKNVANPVQIPTDFTAAQYYEQQSQVLGRFFTPADLGSSRGGLPESSVRKVESPPYDPSYGGAHSDTFASPPVLEKLSVLKILSDMGLASRTPANLYPCIAGKQSSQRALVSSDLSLDTIRASLTCVSPSKSESHWSTEYESQDEPSQTRADRANVSSRSFYSDFVTEYPSPLEGRESRGLECLDYHIVDSAMHRTYSPSDYSPSSPESDLFRSPDCEASNGARFSTTSFPNPFLSDGEDYVDRSSTGGPPNLVCREKVPALLSRSRRQLVVEGGDRPQVQRRLMETWESYLFWESASGRYLHPQRAEELLDIGVTIWLEAR